MSGKLQKAVLACIERDGFAEVGPVLEEAGMVTLGEDGCKYFTPAGAVATKRAMHALHQRGGIELSMVHTDGQPNHLVAWAVGAEPPKLFRSEQQAPISGVTLEASIVDVLRMADGQRMSYASLTVAVSKVLKQGHRLGEEWGYRRTWDVPWRVQKGLRRALRRLYDRDAIRIEVNGKSGRWNYVALSEVS